MGRRTGSPAFILTAFLLAAGIFILASIAQDFLAVMFMAPFSLGPLVVSLVLALFALRKACQITLILGSVLYAAWFNYLYVGAFHQHPSPQSGIILLFIGFYSLPVMIPVWLLTLILMIVKQPTGKQGDCSSR
jgi:hypothetical protein